jgi:NAD(P)-dependent dehydrogenase (short-subunit alcohol dehydrogenase family)
MILEKFSLEGKSGIVTGGGSGIGKGMASGLVQAVEKLESAADELRQYGGPVIPVQADMADMSDIKNLVDRTVKEFGKIDFLFNNAGIIRRNPCENFLEEDWDDVLAVNLKGPFFLAQAVAKVMISQKRKGKIINTSSLCGQQGRN